MIVVGVIVHYVLSFVFTLIITIVIHRWGLVVGIVGGALLGLALYGINPLHHDPVLPGSMPSTTMSFC
ncbi:MAG: hypothetical protein U0521_10670 [Anaerolineae bacterium]